MRTGLERDMGNGARPLIIYKSLETVSHAEFLGRLRRERVNSWSAFAIFEKWQTHALHVKAPVALSVRRARVQACGWMKAPLRRVPIVSLRGRYRVRRAKV